MGRTVNSRLREARYRASGSLVFSLLQLSYGDIPVTTPPKNGVFSFGTQMVSRAHKPDPYCRLRLFALLGTFYALRFFFRWVFLVHELLSALQTILDSGHFRRTYTTSASWAWFVYIWPLSQVDSPLGLPTPSSRSPRKSGLQPVRMGPTPKCLSMRRPPKFWGTSREPRIPMRPTCTRLSYADGGLFFTVACLRTTAMHS